MNKIEQKARNTRNQAQKIIEEIRLFDYWQSINAEVHLVGSIATDLMLNSRNININIYSEQLSISKSSEAIALIAQHPRIYKVNYIDRLQTNENYIEWQLIYQDSMQKQWLIDMLHMSYDSIYAGLFEKMVYQLNQVLNSETRAAILMLKNDTPEHLKIGGIEYYQAVLRDGIRTYADFTKWRETHPVKGIIQWTPQTKKRS